MPSAATEMKSLWRSTGQMIGQTLRASGADDVADLGPKFRKLRF